MTAVSVVLADRPAHHDRRIAGLDGIRGLAALYVVLSHCWLLSFPGYPANTGPAGLGWLVHGRFAVVLFITLSGFSLAVAPARHGWRLGGLRRYAWRRARRILPGYWAALVISAAIASAVPSLPLSEPPTVRSMIVYGLLLQDVVAAPAPNGVFWSIAVETGLYLVFPVVLWARRRVGAAAALAVATVPVLGASLLFPGLFRGSWPTGYALELAPLFVLGVLTARIVTAGDRVRGLPWLGLAALTGAPVLALIGLRGPVWTVTHYYWLDLAAGPSIACLLAAVATGRPAALVRLLTLGPVRSAGGASYSLYLLHMPIVALVSTLLVRPATDSRTAAFWVTVLVAVPLCLTAARLFSGVCETPFRPRRPACAAVRPAAGDRRHLPGDRNSHLT